MSQQTKSMHSMAKKRMLPPLITLASLLSLLERVLHANIGRGQELIEERHRQYIYDMTA
jgi:hypothetical protein